MRITGLFLVVLVSCVSTSPQTKEFSDNSLSNLIVFHDYSQKRVSSYDRSGANADFRPISPGETLTLFDESGPGLITHLWFTLWSPEQAHLKKLVLRMYWDGEPTPSVETPLGDFFGLGLGDFFLYQSIPLVVGPDRALNSFFPMPFQNHGRITVTNMGSEKVDAFYFNIDYRALKQALPPDALYFHAQYRQATPSKGRTNQWQSNGDPAANNQINLLGRSSIPNRG